MNGRETILLVEDEPAVLALTQIVLEQGRYPKIPFQRNEIPIASRKH